MPVCDPRPQTKATASHQHSLSPQFWENWDFFSSYLVFFTDFSVYTLQHVGVRLLQTGLIATGTDK